MILERADNIINIMEMKYNEAEYILDKEENYKFRRRMEAFFPDKETLLLGEMINETNSFIFVDEIKEIVIKKSFFLSNLILDNLYIEIQKSMNIPILCGLFCQFDEMIRKFHEMIRERAHLHPTFAPSKSDLCQMSNTKMQPWNMPCVIRSIYSRWRVFWVRR